MEHTFWIWYPGDFELYHAMKQDVYKRQMHSSGKRDVSGKPPGTE